MEVCQPSHMHPDLKGFVGRAHSVLLVFPWVTLQEEPLSQEENICGLMVGKTLTAFARYSIVFCISVQLPLLMSHSSFCVFMHED